MAQNKEPPKGLDSDGASGLATMFFGWLLAFIYIACLGLVFIHWAHLQKVEAYK